VFVVYRFPGKIGSRGSFGRSILRGAGGSIVGEKMDPNYGKTMKELAKLVKESLDGEEFYSIKQLANRCKFEIDKKGDYNLEDFLSKLANYYRKYFV